MGGCLAELVSTYEAPSTHRCTALLVPLFVCAGRAAFISAERIFEAPALGST